jgi:hypothetical protein
MKHHGLKSDLLQENHCGISISIVYYSSSTFTRPVSSLGVVRAFLFYPYFLSISVQPIQSDIAHDKCANKRKLILPLLDLEPEGVHT